MPLPFAAHSEALGRIFDRAVGAPHDAVFKPRSDIQNHCPRFRLALHPQLAAPIHAQIFAMATVSAPRLLRRGADTVATPPLVRLGRGLPPLASARLALVSDAARVKERRLTGPDLTLARHAEAKENVLSLRRIPQIHRWMKVHGYAASLFS
jgi:hypothetical protein